ncbi:hypothetical protein MKX01_042537 [Papaver californicum]|nr:hypothetical protein MKX01_042537 [Papaver californicum]
MYATRSVSLYREDSIELSRLAPADEAHGSSGYLYITDDEEESVVKDVKGFLFPHNKFVNVVYRKGVGYSRNIEWEKVWFIPVPDQPLSSNRYYIIRAYGKHKGKAITCSREEDMGTCFCSKYIKDIKPKALNHRNIYQLIEVLEQKHGGFLAKSVAPDGIPPEFLRESGWNAYKSDSKLCQLTEASGLNFSLRNLLPDLNFPMHSQNSSAPVTIGKWYCPAVFIRDGDLRHQMENSLFYEMTLEQFWEAIYKCENDYYSPNNVVAVSKSVKKETMKLFGMEATIDNNIDNGTDGIQWIRNELNNILGLNIAIVEKMKWIQEKGGFIGGGGERDTRVEHVEEFKQGNGWERFGCFVLVERFVLKTMSGAVVFTCDYKHTHQLQCKWE